MRTLIALLALTAIACGEAADNTTQVVPIEPAATAAPADAPAAEAAPAEAAGDAPAYVCPMCDGVSSDQPGDCPKCGMPLVKPEDAAGVDAEAYHADCPHHKAAGEECDCEKKGEHAGHDHAHGDHADCPHHKAEAEAEAAEAVGE